VAFLDVSQQIRFCKSSDNDNKANRGSTAPEKGLRLVPMALKAC